MQRRLLETEGVPIEGGSVNMKRYAWSPLKGASSHKRRRSKR
jgi:hypothetical protein